MVGREVEIKKKDKKKEFWQGGVCISERQHRCISLLKDSFLLSSVVDYKLLHQNLKPKNIFSRHLFLWSCRWASSPATE